MHLMQHLSHHLRKHLSRLTYGIAPAKGSNPVVTRNWRIVCGYCLKRKRVYFELTSYQGNVFDGIRS